MRALILALMLVIATASEAQQLPTRSFQYRAILTAEARQHWGHDANVALFAAQIHQESMWNHTARSPVGALGLGQFMPATAQDMNRWYPQQLGEIPNGGPLWSIRALVLYDRRLFQAIRPKVQPEISLCDRYAMMLSAYNGGLGWVNRDRTLTQARGDNPDAWWGGVERHSNRAGWAIRENRDYPVRILHRHLPLYLGGGYPGENPCSPR